MERDTGRSAGPVAGGLAGLRPALVALLVALVPAATGALALARRAAEGAREAEIGDVLVRVERTAWVVDPMDHGGGFAMPPAMTPDLPLPARHRLDVEILVHNRGPSGVRFDVHELSLRLEADEAPRAGVEDALAVDLGPARALSAHASFDVPEQARAARLVWTHGDVERTLASLVPPRHAPVPAPAEWPGSASALPPGDPAAGERAFVGKLACGSCHGHPRTPNGETLGPDLHGIGAVAGSRVPGRDAAQYLYESILRPDAFIAPRCARGAPCRAPSAMPSYGGSLSLQEMADVIAFLRAQID